MHNTQDPVADALQRASERFQKNTECAVKRLVVQHVAEHQLPVLEFNLGTLLEGRLVLWISNVRQIWDRHLGKSNETAEEIERLYQAVFSEIDAESKRLVVLVRRLHRKIGCSHFTVEEQTKWLRRTGLAMRKDLGKERSRALQIYRWTEEKDKVAISSAERTRSKGTPPDEEEGGPLPAEKRAQLVAQLIEELNTLRPQLSSEEDYHNLQRNHRNFLCFQIARRFAPLKEKLIDLQLHRRHIRLAQELVAAHAGRQLSTVQKDWKTQKPTSFKRSVKP